MAPYTWLPSVTSFCKNPTFDGTSLTLETHILDFSGDLYGRRVWLEFYKYMRPEMKFDSHDELKARIETDLREIREFFDSDKNT